MMEGLDIRALSNLLKTNTNNEEEDISDDEQTPNYSSGLGPASIGAIKKPPPTCSSKTAKKDEKDIWDADDVNCGEEYECTDDTRPQPEYSIVYKQAIRTEDMFLQMGGKNTGTASCEDMIVKIELPNTKGGDISLDVKDTYLDCRTPQFRLGLHLPNPVDSKTSKAQWLVEKHQLNVTLRMNREFDFVNF